MPRLKNRPNVFVSLDGVSVIDVRKTIETNAPIVQSFLDSLLCQAEFRRLRKMANLKPGWDGYKALPPNGIAIDNAKAVLSAVKKPPTSVRPSVEGGIFLRYMNGDRELFVECYNDGDIGYTSSLGGRATDSQDMSACGLDKQRFLDRILDTMP